MKHIIETGLMQAVCELKAQGLLPDVPVVFNIENTKDKSHGDFASNIALILAKPAQKNPRKIAELLQNAFPKTKEIEKIEIAGPGFINFFLAKAARGEIVARILHEGDTFGRSKMGREKKVLLEFVSSNPTGPLHVGHGRHAAFGDVVANLLNAIGFKVSREYYINDDGRQMDILAVSVFVRYLQRCGEELPFPRNAYKGDYVKTIADTLFEQYGKQFHCPPQAILADLPPDASEGGDKEIYIDALIERVKSKLQAKYQTVFDVALDSMISDIREDLREFGVHYDGWFSERAFVKNHNIPEILGKLEASGYIYEKDGAEWFRSTSFGDEKDRVIRRKNGTRTYFANDVAYHLNKFERGFDIAIDIFGSDHHGYTARMRAAMQASGINPERLLQLLVQFVTLYRNGEQVSMSTRGGNFVTLRELREEVGNDAARFFYVMRRYEQHMDFDLDLAKAETTENPVYYVQYAYARICSVFKQLRERHLAYDQDQGLAFLDCLDDAHEKELLNILYRYPEVVVNAALQYEPQILTNYLREIASAFHTYYNAQQFLVDDEKLRNARLALISATAQTLLNGFKLIGISAPESM